MTAVKSLTEARGLLLGEVFFSKMKDFHILKSDIFEELFGGKIFPGSPNFAQNVKEVIFDFLNTSEGEAPNYVVDSVVREANQIATKANQHWKTNGHDSKRFVKNLSKPGRWLTKTITITDVPNK